MHWFIYNLHTVKTKNHFGKCYSLQAIISNFTKIPFLFMQYEEVSLLKYPATRISKFTKIPSFPHLLHPSLVSAAQPLNSQPQHQWRVEFNTPFTTASVSSPPPHPLSISYPLQDPIKFASEIPSISPFPRAHSTALVTPRTLQIRPNHSSSPLRFITSMPRHIWAAPTQPSPPTPSPVFR